MSFQRKIRLGEHRLRLADVEAVARKDVKLELSLNATEQINESRALLRWMLARNFPIYGVTTGFGRLADTTVSPYERKQLQRNLIRSHAAGVGRPLPESEVRAVIFLRAATLARGHSGCRQVVVERLLDLLNHRIHPVVPEVGSVGASGDLVPLAHIGLGLIGEGRATSEGVEDDIATLMVRAGIEPLVLAEKEGMALVNGTQATTGLGVLAVCRLGRALDAAEVVGCTSLEGLRGTPEPFRQELNALRPHPGQVASARRLWAIVEGSEIRESHRKGDPRVQDAYSLRCMPQIHGAARDALDYIAKVLETECNSTTDNPVVLPGLEEVISGGNFHAQIVAQALDLAAISAADLASVSERRTDRLLNPDLSGLPAFLAPKPGLQSGFMMAQVTAADALAEMRVLASPASIDSVPTSASQEDHVSMGMAAARKLRRSVELLEKVLAVEMLCAAQAVEYHRPLRAGVMVEEAIATVRGEVGPLEDDRALGKDIEAVAGMIRAGSLVHLGGSWA